MGLLEQANDYIESRRMLVDRSFAEKFHLSCPIGWMNDPNGFVFYRGEYHVFYQHYPFGTVNGTMYWGHAASRDLISWRHLPVALAPDCEYDRDGVWSGGAVEKDGKLYAFYTGNRVEGGVAVQTQNLAISEDGIHFTKYAGNPVVHPGMLPTGASAGDFRDPFVFRRGEEYLMLLGNRDEDRREGKLQVFSSRDLLRWQYRGVFLELPNFGVMWECPNFARLEGGDVVFFSPQLLPPEGFRYHNVSSTVCCTGSLPEGSYQFALRGMDEADFGHDFYATQVTGGESGTVLVAWMQMWGRRLPTHELGHGWCGSLALPRVIEVRGGRLRQRPVPAVYSACRSAAEGVWRSGETASLRVPPACRVGLDAKWEEGAAFTVRVAKRGGFYTAVTFDRGKGLAAIDRSRSEYPLAGDAAERSRSGVRCAEVEYGDTVRAEIFVDVCSVEVFVQDGERVLTSTHYTKDCGEIEFVPEGTCEVTYRVDAIDPENA